MFVQMRRQVELYQWWLARACQWISSVSPFKHFTPPNQSKGCDSISQFYHSCFAARLVSVFMYIYIYIHIYIYMGVCVCISTSLAPSICNRTIKAIRCSDAFGLRFVTTERLQHNHVSTATQFLADAWKKNCTRSELNLGLIVQICADVARRCQDISTARVFDLNKPVWPRIVSILYILWYSGMLLSLFVACQQKCQFHLDFAYDVIAYSNTHALYIYIYICALMCIYTCKYIGIGINTPM